MKEKIFVMGYVASIHAHELALKELERRFPGVEIVTSQEELQPVHELRQISLKQMELAPVNVYLPSDERKEKRRETQQQYRGRMKHHNRRV